VDICGAVSLSNLAVVERYTGNVLLSDYEAVASSNLYELIGISGYLHVSDVLLRSVFGDPM
jgi:hypothetical protein